MTPRVIRSLFCVLFSALPAIALDRAEAPIIYAALYPQDGRRLMTDADLARYPGAGVLMCYSDFGTLERGAAAWLVASHDLVVLNAHNFVDRKLAPTHPVTDCFFRIGGANYYFDADSLRIGASAESKGLHITDDWALLRLLQPTPDTIAPQPAPDVGDIRAGSAMKVVMVSPAGHSNSRIPATIEFCEIRRIDEPTESHVRRARHNCNDGYGGSGSGLFSKDGRLIAMHSASLDMNLTRPFDNETHYGSALLFEGDLAKAIREAAAKSR